MIYKGENITRTHMCGELNAHDAEASLMGKGEEI